MPYRTLSLDIEPPLARIRLRGKREGASLAQELDTTCAEINDRADVHVVVLAGEGDAFATGNLAPDALGRNAAPFSCLESMAQPVACAIDGDVIGLGLALALACDIRIAPDNARFGVGESDSPLFGGLTQRVPRLVGRGEASRLLLLGETIGAHEALRIGLVSAVAPGDRLDAEADAIAQRIASRGPIAVRYAKEAIRRGLDMPLDQALRYETDLTVILQTTEDRAEGVRAFREKREPEFKGK